MWYNALLNPNNLYTSIQVYNSLNTIYYTLAINAITGTIEAVLESLLYIISVSNWLQIHWYESLTCSTIASLPVCSQLSELRVTFCYLLNSFTPNMTDRWCLMVIFRLGPMVVPALFQLVTSHPHRHFHLAMLTFPSFFSHTTQTPISFQIPRHRDWQLYSPLPSLALSFCQPLFQHRMKEIKTQAGQQALTGWAKTHCHGVLTPSQTGEFKWTLYGMISIPMDV